MLGRKQKPEDFAREIEAHMQLEAERLEEQGLSPEGARAAAHRSFGNVTRSRERFYESQRWLWWDHFVQDVRYGLRMLAKSPGFTVVVILTLALGIGATTAIFSVVDATLLDPLPYANPEQLVTIVDELSGIGAHDVGMSQPEWLDLQASGLFQNVSPAWYDENNLTGASRPARVHISIGAPNYFEILGVRPQLGRAFHPDDRSPGILSEVVISDSLWKRSFGGDPHALGETVRMDTDLYQIVGVMPAGFHPPGRTPVERNIEIWAATSFYGPPMVDHPPRSGRNLPTAVARLAPGLTLEQAQSRVDALVASLQKEFPGDYPAANGWGIRLVPLKESIVGNVRQSLAMLLCAVGLVLLIACVNIANLMLARGSARAREMALRQALGAPRKRLTRQLLTESMLLSLGGGIAGTAILLGIKGFLLQLVPESLPQLNAVTVNWTVMVFALMASLGAGLIFGLAPAWHAGRQDLTHMLKREGRGSTGAGEQARTRRALVVTEFALSLVLMIAAGLLLRSFRDLLNVPLGFHPENTMAIRTRLPYPNDTSTDIYRTPDQKAAFNGEVLRRVKALPGVEEAAMGDTAAIPLDPSQRMLKVISEGSFVLAVDRRDTQNDQPSMAERSSVSPEYFHLVGIPLVRGRLFTAFDNQKSPDVAVVNEALAQKFWPHEDAIGKRFRRTRPGAPWITVVGVIANARTESLADANVPKIYLDLYQAGGKHLAIFLRGHLDPAELPDQVREQVQAVDDTLPVFGAQMLSDTVSDFLSVRKFSMEMVELFAVTALLMAGLGIYGVISYMVSERTHEIGIRLALGAQQKNILRMVVRQGLAMAIVGAAVGIVGALVVARLMAGLLYSVRPTDPLTFFSVAALLLFVALVACYLPALRATKVDPMVALRDG